MVKLLILGAGGVGGYFGGRLVAAGADVQFLVRPSRVADLEANSLRIRSPLGDLTTPVHAITQAYQPADAILLACKAYDLTSAMDAIAPAIGPDTLILPLLNGIRHLDELDARFEPARVLGGLCHIGVARADDGSILHLNTLQHLAFGPRDDAQLLRIEQLYAALSRGGLEPVCTDTIIQAMWEKFTFLAAYAGITTLMRAPIGRIASTPDGSDIVRQMLAECVATATYSGYPPLAPAFETMLATLTDPASLGTASMMRDLAKGLRTEHEHIIGDMVKRGEACGLETPLLRISLTNMRTHEPSRQPTGPIV